MNEIVMPKLSDTMTEGRLVSWNKRVGEEVRRGDVIAEVETDKANMELEAFVPGVLLEIKVQAGVMVQVGTVIALIGQAGEKGEGAPAAPAPEPEAKQPEAKQPEAEQPEAEQPEAEQPEAEQPGGKEEPPAAKEKRAAEPSAPESEGAQVQRAAPQKAQPQGETVEAAPAAPAVPGSEETQPADEPVAEPKRYVHTKAPSPGGPAPEFVPAAAGGERAAPVVRRRARELGIDLSRVHGSGPDGRILLQDLEEAGKGAPRREAEGTAAQPAQPQAGQAAQPAAPPRGPRLVQEVKVMSRLRGAIAKTVADSWKQIPHFTVTMEIVMDEAEAVRRQLKQGGLRVTVNDIILKGVALALQKFPQMNARFTPEGLQFHGEVNVCVAVGVPEGVLMPVIRGCQDRSLLEIAQESDRLVQRARAGSLTEQEMSGGTFSVSNLGMFNVSSFSAIIHPSQAGVLAVGAVADVPVVRSGVLASAKVMKVTLSADHRVVDGAYAAEFLVELKEILENPVRLLI